MASSCDSIPDSENDFVLKEPLKERTIRCDWVRHRPQEQWIWCNYRNVKEMCPATCGGCQNIPKPFCDEVLEFDNESRFHVEGTAGSEMKTCEWAKRLNTIGRCSIKAVQVNCPETCFTLCDERPTSSPSAPSSSIIGNAIVDDPSSKSTNNEMKILLGVFGSLLGILVLLLLFALTRRRNSNIVKDSAEEVSSVDGDDDDKTNVHSLIASSSSAFLGSSSMVPKNSSFVPPDQNNLGAKYSARDVQCCTNFVCDGCAEGGVTFVKSPNKRRSDGFLRRRANSAGDLVCEIVQDRPYAAFEV